MIKTLTIGNVELPNRYVLAPMAGLLCKEQTKWQVCSLHNRPAISSVMQGTGSRASVHGNDQCKGAPV